MKLAHVGINLVSCAVALLTFSLQAETDQPLLLVVNKSEATLAIVDTTSGRLLAKVPTGDFPHEVAASNNGRMAFVTNYGDARPGNTLSVIDVVARKELRRVDLGTLRRPHGVTVVDGKAVLTAEDARQVARYDPSTNRIDWRFDTGQDVTHMVLASRSGRMLFTSNIGSNTIGIIEQQAKDWKQTLIRVGPGPEGLDLSPDGRELWAAHTGNGGVSIIDVSAKERYSDDRRRDTPRQPAEVHAGRTIGADLGHGRRRARCDRHPIPSRVESVARRPHARRDSRHARRDSRLRRRHRRQPCLSRRSAEAADHPVDRDWKRPRRNGLGLSAVTAWQSENTISWSTARRGGWKWVTLRQFVSLNSTG